MKQVILDTSFILTCIKDKIDFIEQLYLDGFQILIPINVLNELTKISKDEKTTNRSINSNLALKILNKSNFKKIETIGRTTDKSIINFAKENPYVFVATLDKEIKNSVRNRKIVIKNKKKIIEV